MRKLVLLSVILFLSNSYTFGQFYAEDFDNGEPDPWIDTLIITIDSSSTLWQIGIPQKEFLDEAFSFPNAIITDTVSPYPASDTAIFTLKAALNDDYYGIVAIKWVQKLDIDSLDGGTVDFSIDGGETWENAFVSPYVYNWYGWDNHNIDTLANETIVFSKRDSLWREIWFCFDYSWLSTLDDSLQVRYSFFSDSIQGSSDGWVIDNIMIEPTWVHTVGEAPKSNSYVSLYPNPATERINIELKKSDEFHIIKELKIYSESGQIVKSFETIPTKFFVDVSDLPSGVYEVLVRSNLKTEVHKVIVSK
ncbi:MAG TPA: T9SS type A sorting domain-containing protein [Cryomorphaceae bacterium]|nr:T9SS type A sorting domain-containing protein [Cryomorphaceae bacterium]